VKIFIKTFELSIFFVDLTSFDLSYYVLSMKPLLEIVKKKSWIYKTLTMFNLYCGQPISSLSFSFWMWWGEKIKKSCLFSITRWNIYW